MEACQKILVSGLESLNLSLSDDKIRQLLDFIKLIEKWNKAYNLTAIRNREEMARLHILDSLAIIPHIEGQRIIDIGTGAGLPGIPLAICLPGISFTLLDSNAKKTRFVQQAVIELGLGNVRVIHMRIERFQDESGFDVILARAYASLADIVEQTRRLLSAGGVILAQKGKSPERECLTLERAKIETLPLKIPGVDAERHLVAVTLPG